MQLTDPAMRQAAQYISKTLETHKMRNKGKDPLRIAIFCNSERLAREVAEALQGCKEE